MANINSAKKRIRVIDINTARNRRIKNHLKAVLKNFEAAMAEGNIEVAAEKGSYPSEQRARRKKFSGESNN